MSESNVNSAGPAKWEWKAGGTLPASKKPMDIKVKAVLQSVLMTVVAFLLFHFKHQVVVPRLIGVLAVVVLIGGLFVPPIFHGFEKFGKLLGVWVGKALTYILLVPFYFIVFAPAHLILNARHIDPMAREFPTKLASYWIPRRPVETTQYKKQH
jgi:hypothetical protein